MKRKTLIVLCVIFVIVIIGAIIVFNAISSMSKNLEQLSAIQVEEVDLSNIADGTYNGRYEAPPIIVEVAVTIHDHAMTAIELLQHDNGQGSAAEAILGEVIDLNSLQVDSVSGATYSSKVILLAIQAALNNSNQ